MNNYKKILAGVLATSMVLSSSMVALADEGRTTGSGKVEGALSHDVFRVVLPTEESYTGAFDYVMDPLGLLLDTNNTKYEGYKFDNTSGGLLYFHNNTKAAASPFYTYTNESDALTVQNKSTKAVNLTVKVTATSVDGIPMTTDDTFGASGTADTDTSLYLALVGEDAAGTKTTKAIDSTGMAFISVPLDPIQAATPGTDPEPYIIQWNPITDAYEYVPNPASNDTNATIDSYSFNLIGKCNPVAAAGATGPSREDWLEVLEPGLSPELEIVWTVENPFEVQIDVNTTGLIKIMNCDGDLWDSLIVTDSDGEYIVPESDGTWEKWDVEVKGEKEFQLSDSWVDYLKGRTATITVKLSDGSTSSRTVTFPS